MEVKEEAKAAAVRVAAVRGEATAEEVMEAAVRVAVREAVMGVVVTEVAATAAATAAAVTAEVATEEATVEAATAAETAADRTHRPHSSARRAARPSRRSCTPRYRHPAATRGTRQRRRPRAGTRPTPTPAPRRARSRCHATPEAPHACRAERRAGCTAPAPRPTSRCAGSHPCLLMSCRTFRTLCHTPTQLCAPQRRLALPWRGRR